MLIPGMAHAELHLTTLSNAGNFSVDMRYEQPAVAVNTLLSAMVQVGCVKADPCVVRTVSVTAQMPAHHHGLNYTPLVERVQGNRFQVQGLRYHMPGYWQVFVDIETEQGVERAQFDLEL